MALASHPIARVTLDQSGRLQTEPFDISLDAWSQNFTFHGVVQQLTTDDNRLHDSSMMIVRCPTSLIMSYFPTIRASDLRTLNGFHGIEYKRKTIPEMEASLRTHLCNNASPRHENPVLSGAYTGVTRWDCVQSPTPLINRGSPKRGEHDATLGHGTLRNYTANVRRQIHVHGA
ncbi:hypothetical protein DFP72DRAFT_840179 [Ephemerocybe angulata]|uniref:Uncharacterized protein n=1 Tax=Ephemerocybe angulata TaxID=980116 RepID=A0A8H6IJC9_9AGAR|nr:hypothetical protein DFP72DRAFT_840179 [Tulosesus angulatus]